MKIIELTKEEKKTILLSILEEAKKDSEVKSALIGFCKEFLTTDLQGELNYFFVSLIIERPHIKGE